MPNSLISKITLGGVTYDLKDAEARAKIATLEGLVSGGVQIVVANSLPTASVNTVGKIYFIPHTHTTNDTYDEYLTIVGGSGSSTTYKWEKIGNTDIDLSGYSVKGHTHSVTTNVTVATKNYTPAGSVTLPSFSSAVTPTNATVATVTSAGTGYTLNQGSVSKGADSTSSFATSGLTGSYNAATETLVLSAAGTAKAVTASGSVSYTKPTLSGALPTFSTASVLSGVSVSTTADGAATFSGTQANITPTLTNNAVVTDRDA